MHLKPELLLDGHVRGLTGYGHVSRNLALSLFDSEEFTIGTVERDWMNVGEPDDLSADQLLKLDQMQLTRIDSSQALFLSVNIASNFKPGGRFRIGYSMLETNKVSRVWRDFCNTMHLLLVPTEFNVKTFRDGGVTIPIKALPIAVDSEIFKPFERYDAEGISPLHRIHDANKFAFFCNAQWLPGDRKGIERLIAAFLEVFKDNSEVSLVLKVFNASSAAIDRHACIDHVKAAKARSGVGEYPKILVVHGQLTHQELACWYQSTQAFVLPTLGESWGLPVHEALLCGVPAIVTGGSGPSCYLDSDLVRFLQYDIQPIPPAMAFRDIYEPDMLVTVPKQDDLKRALLDVYNNYDSWHEKALKQREKLLHLTWQKTAAQFVTYLREAGALEKVESIAVEEVQ